MTRLAGPIIALLMTGSALALPADRLATLIGDRVAGAPVDCIAAAEIDAVHIARAENATSAALVYVMRSPGTIYLNRPVSGATFLHDGVELAVDQTGTQLCRATLVRVVNENSRQPIAAVELGAFVPYRRPVTP